MEIFINLLLLALFMNLIFFNKTSVSLCKMGGQGILFNSKYGNSSCVITFSWLSRCLKQ